MQILRRLTLSLSFSLTNQFHFKYSIMVAVKFWSNQNSYSQYTTVINPLLFCTYTRVTCKKVGKKEKEKKRLPTLNELNENGKSASSNKDLSLNIFAERRPKDFSA